MAGPPPGFEGFLQQKYDIDRQRADAQANLSNAQAGSIPSTTASENALRASQANETNTRASTLQPLANASIASTQAGIGETQARSNLYGTQAGVAGLELGNTGDLFAQQVLGFLRGKSNQTGFQPPSAPAGANPAAPAAPAAPAVPNVARSGNMITGDFGNAQSGTGNFSFSGGDSARQSQIDPGAQHLSKGTANVKHKPGKGMKPPAGGAGLAGLMGMLGGGAGAPPPGAMPGAMPGAPQPGGMPPGGGIPFRAGTSTVPGHGSGHVDTVPAMLAPGEAVLNKAAAEHMGRGAIETLNAIGRHKMGMTGAPASPPAAPQAAPLPAKGMPGAKKRPGFAEGTANVGGGGMTTYASIPPAVPGGGPNKKQPGKGMPPKKVAVGRGMK